MQSGISAGTSIRPAPCALDIMKDQSASPACPAGERARSVAPAHRRRTTTTSSAPATTCSTLPSIDTPSATAAATTAVDEPWPTAIGIRARSACARSCDRTPQAAAHTQPLAGFSP